jgi:Tfp pilus assembly protein PilZ
MRFLGDSPQEAERQASEFIRRHIASAGLSVAEAPGPVKARAPVAAGVAEANGPPDGGESRRVPDPSGRRKLCSLPVAFGHNAETRKARVANVSERGMFVATDEPMEPGSVIRLRLQADSLSIPIRGMVVWTRLKEEQGRMKGMGIRLFKPPALYLSFVRGLP